MASESRWFFRQVANAAVIGFVMLVGSQAVSSTLANTFFYVAPVIALALSALFLGERLNAIKVVAASVSLLGVFLMVSGTRHPAKQRAGR